jgi:outer membrane protein OmpA-like peptidoglycan-associated protein
MRSGFILFFILLSVECSSQAINHTIYFNVAESTISEKDIKWMDSVSSYLLTSKNYSIALRSYADADGSEKSNQALSEKRAEAVKKIFLDNKLEAKYIESLAIGEKEPVADNATEAGKAKNRRVQLAITYHPVADPQKEVKETIPSDSVPEKKKSEIKTVLADGSLKVGQTLILKNLNFEGGTPVLLPESDASLKELLKVMQENPKLEIEIGGHVCCADDMPLSVARAQKVYNYLKGYGISKDRMTYKGYSHSKPLASERTEAGRTANRRVEIKILKVE